MWKNSFEVSSRSALTLVEVVTGLLLLATLLVSILLAFNTHTKQIKTATQRLLAIELTDQLISGWYQADQFPEPDSEGMFGSQPNFKWKLVQKRDKLANIPAKVLRVEVFQTSPTAEDVELAVVELLAPAGRRVP